MSIEGGAEPAPSPFEAALARMKADAARRELLPVAAYDAPEMSAAERLRLREDHERLLLVADTNVGPPARGEASPPTKLVEPNVRTVRGYDGFQRIDRGGQAYVYRARSIQNGTKVAFKLCHGTSDEARRRLVKEFFICNLIEDPRIARALEFGYLEDAPWATFRFVKGTKLTERVPVVGSAVNPPPAATGIARLIKGMRGLLDSLDVVHRSGVLHRDIKPPNIIVDSDENYVLIDWGVAYCGALKFRDTLATGSPVGTLEYMAPERFLNPFDEGGPAVDVYAVGVTMIELLVGRRPADYASQAEFVAAARARRGLDPDFVRSNPNVSDALARVLERATAFDPARRFRTAREFGDALADPAKWASQNGPLRSALRRVGERMKFLRRNDGGRRQ